VSGRIRTVKPEWLEDEGLLRAGAHARVLSVALLLLADDYGNGRFIPEVMAAQVFPFEESSRVFREAFAALSGMEFVTSYEVRGQGYFHIRNWKAHQRVDKPGKPRVPGPEQANGQHKTTTRETVANGSRDCRETVAPDHDHDLDHDHDREGNARGAPPPASFADSVGAPDPDHDPWTEVAAAWLDAGWQGDQHTAKRDFVRIAEHARRQCGDRWLDETRSRLTRWLEAKHERIHKPPKWFLEDWPSLDATASSGPPEPADLQAEWTRLHNRELRLAEAQRDLGRLSADERLEREGEIATGLLEVRKSMRTIRSQIEASERRPRP
jgi:hypothetical protein